MSSTCTPEPSLGPHLLHTLLWQIELLMFKTCTTIIIHESSCTLHESSGIINRAVSGEGEGAVPEVGSQAVKVVGAVEVVDTGLAEGLARDKQAVAAMDEVEKVKNRKEDQDRLEKGLRSL
jgi:hypothetical protein